MPVNGDDFETALRAALRREAPSSDFAARLNAKIQARKPVTPIWRRPLMWAIAAALLLAAVIPVTVSEYQYRQHERGREASRQLMIALNITHAKLRQTREKILHTNRHAL